MPSPVTVNCKLRQRAEDEECFEWLFREANGSLMWLATMTRPGIPNAVWDVARFSHDPSKRHGDAVERILKYLKYARFKDLTLGWKKGLT